MLSVADALLRPGESAFCPVPRSSLIQIDFMIPHGEVSLVRRSKQHHNIIVVKKILNLVWTNQNYKVKLKQFTAVKSNLVYKCKSACVLCSVWSPVVEIRGENVSALMINAPIRLPIYPSVHPSPPPILHPPRHTLPGFFHHPGPTTARPPASSASAEMNYIAFHTCFCSETLLHAAASKKISKGG